MRYAVIMAGGSGTRLWPLSRQGRPKQLIRFLEGPGGHRRCLLELALERPGDLVPPGRRFVCTLESHRALIRREIPSLRDDLLIGEPCGRDTLNAAGLSAALLHRRDPEAVMLTLTADHIVEPHDRFRQAAAAAFELVEADPRRLVTFSITPTHPATGYGYVERGKPIEQAGLKTPAYRVAKFVEKPNAARAEAYLRSGVFGWNSGMFVWKASTFLGAVRRFKPESYEKLMAIAESWETPARHATLERLYPTLPKISLDYAVLEPATLEKDLAVCTVPTDVSWLDVGNWASYARTLKADAAGNRYAGAGPALASQSKDTTIVNETPGHTVVALGCEGFTIVRTPEATLVMPTRLAEQVKSLQDALAPELR